MKTKQCNYVEASELFKGLSKLYDAYIEAEPSFTWGDANRTLITASSLYDDVDEKGVGSESKELSKQMDKLCKRVLAIGGDTYVDMEN